MFPLLLEKVSPELDEAMMRVVIEAGALGHGFAPSVTEELAEFMLSVNSYYTNAMEGNPSRLKDIEQALENHFSADPTARHYQLEHLAHIEVQKEMLVRLRDEPELNVCSLEFLCWLHERFYSKLPAELRFAKTVSGKKIEVVPGAIREKGVQVGTHHAPETRTEIEHLLRQFGSTLEPAKVPASRRVMALATSHQRFLWIHPFVDGNGRVARLLTSAYAYKTGVSGHFLWTVVRAFARDRSRYDGMLARADRPRRNDLDGRGPLSTEDLAAFVRYFVDCCLDQLEFMKRVFDPALFEKRVSAFFEMKAREGAYSKSVATALARLFKEGELRRGDIKEICGVQGRQANKIVSEMLGSKFAKSSSSKGPLRMNLNSELAAILFPDLA